MRGVNQNMGKLTTTKEAQKTDAGGKAEEEEGKVGAQLLRPSAYVDAIITGKRKDGSLWRTWG